MIASLIDRYLYTEIYIYNKYIGTSICIHKILVSTLEILFNMCINIYIHTLEILYKIVYV